MIRSNYGFEAKTEDGILSVTLHGEIDHHGAVGLREDLDRLIIRERPRKLQLNLSQIEFMDSAGLGLLMGRYRLMREIGGVTAISSPNPRVMKILHLAGMERYFEIEDAPKGERI